MNPFYNLQVKLIQYNNFGQINLGLIVYSSNAIKSKVIITDNLNRVLAFDDKLKKKQLNTIIKLLKNTFDKNNDDKDQLLVDFNFENDHNRLGSDDWLDKEIQNNAAYFPNISFNNLDRKIVTFNNYQKYVDKLEKVYL